MYTLIMASINYRIVYHTYSNKLKKIWFSAHLFVPLQPNYIK